MNRFCFAVTTFVVAIPCLLSGDDRVVTEGKWVPNNDGSGLWHIEWKYGNTTQPATTEPATAGGPTTNQAGQGAGDGGGVPPKRPPKIPSQSKCGAKHYLDRNGSDLRDAAHDPHYLDDAKPRAHWPPLVVNEGIDDEAAKRHIDEATQLSNAEWANTFKNDSACLTRDGCTKDGKIYVKQSYIEDPAVGVAQIAALLAHEGIHSELQSASNKLSPEMQEAFIDKFLGRQHPYDANIDGKECKGE